MVERTVDSVKWFNERFEELVDKTSLEKDWMQQYRELLEKFSQEVREFSGNPKILDSGCGWGRDIDYFVNRKHFDAVGVDKAPKPLEYGLEKYDLSEDHLRRMDIEDLRFKDETFDGVWCNSVIFFFHKDEMDKPLSELSRVLKKGGILYINFKLTDKPEKHSYIREEYDGSNIKRYLITEQEAENKLEKFNLEVDKQLSKITENEKEEEPPYLSMFCRKT